MTSRALQRVVVRMLYDPAFADAVYADAPSALEGVAITATESSWLVAVDRRRWKADPFRRARGLQSLMEEYPVSTAFWVHRAGLAALDPFFSSPIFHHCIQERRSLALDFGLWLGRHGVPLLDGLVSVAAAVARLRRRTLTRSRTEPGTYALAPTVEVALLPAGTLSAFGSIRETLGSDSRVLMSAIVDPPPQIGRHQVDSGSQEGLIVEGEEDVSIGEGPLSLVRVLDQMRHPTSRQALAELLMENGAEGDEVPDLLTDLEADGLIVFTPPA